MEGTPWVGRAVNWSREPVAKGSPDALRRTFSAVAAGPERSPSRDGGGLPAPPDGAPERSGILDLTLPMPSMGLLLSNVGPKVRNVNPNGCIRRSERRALVRGATRRGRGGAWRRCGDDADVGFAIADRSCNDAL